MISPICAESEQTNKQTNKLPVDVCQLVTDVRVLLTLERLLSTGRIQQFRRQDLHSCWNQSMEQFAARPETTGTVIRPVQAVTEDIFIGTVRPRHSVNSLTVPSTNILTYLLTYLLTFYSPVRAVGL